MVIVVALPIFTHRYMKKSMGKWWQYPTRRGGNIVPILHIYGARAIILFFYDNQGTDYKSQEIVIGVAWPIFNHKYIEGLTEQRYLY